MYSYSVTTLFHCNKFDNNPACLFFTAKNAHTPLHMYQKPFSNRRQNILSPPIKKSDACTTSMVRNWCRVSPDFSMNEFSITDSIFTKQNTLFFFFFVFRIDALRGKDQNIKTNINLSYTFFWIDNFSATTLIWGFTCPFSRSLVILDRLRCLRQRWFKCITMGAFLEAIWIRVPSSWMKVSSFNVYFSFFYHPIAVESRERFFKSAFTSVVFN